MNQILTFLNTLYSCILLLKNIIILFLEPVKLIGEGYYNLDDLTKINVTESFLGLSQDSKQCKEEPFYNCTTRHYIQAVIENCGCLPLTIRQSDQV